MDYLTYLLLTVVIVLGCRMTVTHNLVSDDPYNYRPYRRRYSTAR